VVNPEASSVAPRYPKRHSTATDFILNIVRGLGDDGTVTGRKAVYDDDGDEGSVPAGTSSQKLEPPDLPIGSKIITKVPRVAHGIFGARE
jgi:hypothetical protein